jgi:hypothetical protein
MDKYRINNHNPSKKIQVIDIETGRVLKSWSYRAFEGQGVTENRRIKNANANANNYIKSLQNKQAVASDIAEYNPETGMYTTPDGKSYESLEEARTASEEARRMAELQETEEKTEEQLGELEQLIQRSGRAQRQMAERVGARQQGQLMSQLQRSILGTGGEAQTLEALTPGIQERAERGLLDRLTGIEAQTAQQLQQVPKLAIGQATTMAQLGQTQQQIQDQMARAIMSQETSRAQIQADIDRQPEWWEGIVGAAGTALGTAVGGPVGGAIGGALTSAFTRKPSAQRTSFGSGSLPGTEVLPGSSDYNSFT